MGISLLAESPLDGYLHSFQFGGPPYTMCLSLVALICLLGVNSQNCYCR